MSLCIAAGGAVLALAANSFTLSWTHSVEKTEWVEEWVIVDEKLKVVAASVQGSGAGIDLPENAIRTDEGWRYTPDLPPMETLVMAASGATVSAWTLCANGECLELGTVPTDPLALWSAANCGLPK